MKLNMNLRMSLGLALFALLVSALPGAAQDWPSRTVRIIVPFGAGSTPDLVARMIADQLQQKLGGAFVVENKPGASGNIGTDAVAKAEPDGHTLGVSIAGPLAINTLLFSRLPYDPFRDIKPITVLATQPSVLTVPGNLGVGSVAELVERLKREPGKYNYGSIGSGSVSQLAMEAIALASDAKLVHIPYASSPQAVTALIRGDVHMACLPAISVVPQVQSGNLRMLAVTTPERFALLPDIGTLREAGIAGVESSAWMGLIAPAGLPDVLVERINREVVAALNAPAVRDKLRTQLMLPVGNSPAEFTADLKAELERWAPVIKAANIRIN
jgi:tripartite-type tricarboxylate transporter receptor subunit TctC